jgi:uncharacterized surface protein with fasciclin (FAS1) repeats
MSKLKWFTKKKFVVTFIIILVVVGAALAFYVFYGYKYFEKDANDNGFDTTSNVATDDVVTLIGNNSALTKFNQLLIASGVNFTLQTAGTNYLVLAPRETAFDALPSGYFDSLLTAEKQTIAQNIAKYLVAVLPTTDLVDGQKLMTLAGQEVIVHLSDGLYTFTDAKGNTANVMGEARKATNGAVYVLDTVLLPQ